MSLPPFLLKPVYKDYLWGGTAFSDSLHRELSPSGPWAESWEVSGHPSGPGIIETGPLTGLSLPEALEKHGASLLGSLARGSKKFPLLVKILDAARDLSVQVHPDDHSAAAYGGEPKTEMWHILEAQPGAKVFRGWKKPFCATQYDAAMEAGVSLGTETREIPVEAGDSIMIPGGLVHAIGAGCLILEVQQSSNTTFRIDDWGRLGPDGKPRELHGLEARNHIRWETPLPDKILPEVLEESETIRITRLGISPYFEMRKLELFASPISNNADPTTFRVWVNSGDEILFLRWGADEVLTVPPWRSVFIPANSTDFEAQGVVKSDLLELRLPVFTEGI